jgi:O-methyltransferase
VSDSFESKGAYLVRIAERAMEKRGSLVECGLGNGYSFSLLAGVAQKHDRNLYGFDSFVGFPKPTTEDTSSYAIREGDWSNADSTIVREKVVEKTSENFFHDKVQITPGFFGESLKSVNISEIAFLHLDCDLYGSYMDCFRELYDKVVPGGIIAIDEYLNGIEYAKFPGGYMAFRDFFSQLPVDVCRDFETGKYFLIKR